MTKEDEKIKEMLAIWEDEFMKSSRKTLFPRYAVDALHEAGFRITDLEEFIALSNETPSTHRTAMMTRAAKYFKEINMISDFSRNECLSDNPLTLWKLQSHERGYSEKSSIDFSGKLSLSDILKKKAQQVFLAT